MQTRIQAAIFDMDGVLVDSRVPVARSINYALERLGFESYSEADLHRFVGPPLIEAFRQVLSERGGDPSDAGRCVEIYRERYREASLVETEICPEMKEVTEKIAGRAPLVVATARPAELARPILEALGLAQFFLEVFGPPMDPRSESKEITVGRALRRLSQGAPHHGIVMVGDRRHDAVAGKAHGLLTIGVTWGIGGTVELREAGVDRMVSSPTELLSLFEA